MIVEKRQIRKHIAALKAGYTASRLRQMSEAVTGQVLANQRVMQADSILLYWSLPDEVCTHELTDSLAAQGKTILLPKVCGEHDLSLHLYTGSGDMRRGAFGIMEPCTAALSSSEVQALLCTGSVGIIPGVAFSSDGCRLGRGKGYYDRLLALCPSMYKIGICFGFQMMPSIPCDTFDVRMDEMIC